MRNQIANFILAGNSSYLNRGCEAITRGTVEILKHYYEDPKIMAASFFDSSLNFKKQALAEKDKLIKHIPLTKKSSRVSLKNAIKFLENYLYTKRFKHYSYDCLEPYINDARAVLSIGGDNYSLDYGIPIVYTDLDNYVLSKKKPIILWGASVGPFSKNPQYEKYMKKHLSKVTGIFAREDVTMNYLDKLGIKKNLFRVSDPAFLLPVIKPNNINSIPSNSIGINISPLMSRYIIKGNIEQFAYISANIVEEITLKTDHYIYLIPHVGGMDSNIYKKDYAFLRKVQSHIKRNKERVRLVDDIYSASELKWIISQMQVFLGSRTHSTIASLSCGIPTISFVYSIKAIGINKDVFGHTDYCIQQSEWQPEIICDKLQNVIDNEHTIKEYLNRRIPMIKQKALVGGKYLKELLGD